MQSAPLPSWLRGGIVVWFYRKNTAQFATKTPIRFGNPKNEVYL